jgi:hypothetical protein
MLVDEDDVLDYIIENEISDIDLSSLKAAFKHTRGLDVTNLEEKLATYEDLEEQGLLLRLPCKIGDNVYIIVRNERIFTLKVQEILLFRSGKNLYMHIGCSDTDRKNISYHFSSNDFGKIVFLTEAEAEQTLLSKGDK